METNVTLNKVALLEKKTLLTAVEKSWEIVKIGCQMCVFAYDFVEERERRSANLGIGKNDVRNRKS